MGFLSTLGEIGRNNGNFKRWEAEQRNQQAKREALYRQKQYSEEELNAAAEDGKKIIEIIDIMDNHSESVAENVETATAPMVAAAPYLGLLVATALSGKLLIDPASKNINKIKKELEAKESTQALYKRINLYNLKTTDRKRHFKPSNLYDNFLGIGASKRKGITDSELRRDVLNFYQEYAERVKGFKNKKLYGIASIPLAFLATFIGATIWATNMQVGSSKIARYQARKALEDPKAFVKYTPEQIAQAKAEIDTDPKIKKKKKKEKLNQGFFKSIYRILKDKRDYKKARFNDSDESKIVKRNLSPEEYEQAVRDKEVIQRTVRIINNEAEKYSENMEVAANVLIGGTPLLGGLIGGITSWILSKTGYLDKVLDKEFLNNGNENIRKLYGELKDLNKKIVETKGKRSALDKFNYASKFQQFFAEVEYSLSSSDKKVKFIEKARTWFKSGLVHHKGKNWIIGGIGAIMTGFVGLVLGLKLQKASARAGRYTAKRELEKDPRNFIGYTDEDYNSVQDIKNTEKPKSKVKEIILFIPNVIKQYRAYDKYKKTEFKEQKILQEQLQKQDVSEKQLVDAKNLQRKLFNTFEKVDDKSQLYSESMEAATEIAQPFIVYSGYAIIALPFILGAKKLFKLRENPGQLINKITGWLSSSSWLMKSKLFKKYLKGVAENLPVATVKNYVYEKPLGTILNEVNIREDSLRQIFTKAWKNIEKNPECLNQIDAMLSQIKSRYGIKDSHKLLDMFNELKKIKTNSLDEVLNSNIFSGILDKKLTEIAKIKLPIGSFDFISLVKNLSPEKFKDISQKIGITIDQKTVLEILPKVEKIIKNIPKSEIESILKSAVESFNRNPDEFVAMIRTGIQNGNLTKQIFLTPGLKKALAAAGIAYPTFVIILMYALESWLAEMQLKAGRLGVMKSLEELEDPRYYANIINDNDI